MEKRSRFYAKINRKSTRTLLRFYQTSVQPKYRKQWNGSTVMWTVIFVERFGEMPMDPKPQAGRFALGSTDPRWDVLLHEEEMLRAQEIVLRYLRFCEYLAAGSKLRKEAA